MYVQHVCVYTLISLYRNIAVRTMRPPCITIQLQIACTCIQIRIDITLNYIANTYNIRFTCRIPNTDIRRADASGRRKAGRRGRVGPGRTGCRLVGSPRTQLSLLPPRASKTVVLNVSSESRTKEIVCKPMEEQNQQLATGL